MLTTDHSPTSLDMSNTTNPPPAERTIKFKLDVRAQEARALIALIDRYVYELPDAEDRERIARTRARIVKGLGYLIERYGAQRVEQDDDRAGGR